MFNFKNQKNKMRKILSFSLLAFLLLMGTNVWAESKPWSGDDPATTLNLQTITSSTMGTWNGATSWYLDDDYLIVTGYESYKSVANQTWITQASVGSSSGTWAASTPFKGSTYWTTANYATIKADRYLLYKVTNLKSFKLYGKNNSTSKYLDIFIYTKSGDDYTKVEEIKYTTDANVHTWANSTTLSPAATYYIYITGVGGSNSQVYEVAFERNTSTTPYVSANDVSLYSDETSGQITYTVGNPTGDGAVSAEEKADVDWLSNVAVDAVNSKVTFIATENSTAVSRSATITITYTYDSGSKTATKDVSITQKKHVTYTAVYEKVTAESMVLGGSYIWYGEKLNTGAYLAKGLGSETYLGAVALGSDSRVRGTELSLTDESGVQTFTFVPLSTYGEWNIMLGSNKLGLNGEKKLYLDKGDVSWSMSGTGSELPTFSASYNSSDYTMYANIGSTRFNAYTSIGSMNDAILYHLATESNHTLILNPNDGETAASTYHVKDGFSFVPFAPTRDGYTFLGWSTSASATSPSILAEASYTMPAANTTLYAVWWADNYAISLTANTWATFCFPVDVTIPSDEDLKVYSAAFNSTTNELTATNFTGKIAAGDGVLLKSTKAGTNSFTFEKTTGATPLGDSNDLIGTLVETPASTLLGSEEYLMALKKDENKFVPFSTSADFPAYRACLAVTPNHSIMAAGVRIVENENNTTSIANINASEESVKFIQNGKLFIKKNGVIYDMLGTVVR